MLPIGTAISLIVACAVMLTACQRAALASFVPTLQVTFAAHQSRPGLVPTQRRQAWSASVVAWLRFEPRLVANDIPVRADFDSDTSAIPCEPEDLACIEEFAEGERASAQLLGELE